VWFVATGLMILLAVGLVAAARLRHPQGFQYPDPTLSVEAESPVPGVVTIRAQAQVCNSVRDCRFWWVIELRQRAADGSLEVVRTVELDDAAHSIRARQFRTVRLDLAERLDDVPPGEYNVYAEVRVDDRLMEVDGTIEPSMAEIGRSQWVTVQ
jgi:hypothetical protein